MLDYDATREALYRSYRRPTVFAPEGGAYEADHRRLGVEAARLAYLPAERDTGRQAELQDALARVGFSAPILFRHAATGTEGYGALRAADGLALLAFRGTEPDDLNDLATDLFFPKTTWAASGGKVHRGFAKAALGVLPAVQQWLAQTPHAALLVAGHSLGAAVATLASTVVQPTTLVSVGSPRVGDQAFANGLRGIAIHRLVNCCDAVACLPPAFLGFVHVGPATHVLADGSLSAEPVDQARLNADRSQARRQYVTAHAWRRGRVLIRDLADHAPINYVRAVFPEL